MLPSWRAALPVVCLFVLPGAAWAAPPKSVLIVHAEASDAPGARIVVDAIEATVRKASPGPVEFSVEQIDTGRFGGPAFEQSLADLFAAKYKGHALDLVVAIAEPAARFVLRERARLFPSVPLLIGFVEGRSPLRSTPPEHASVVLVQHDTAGSLRLALALVPSARHALVIGGSSAFDQGWQRVVRDELRGFDSRLEVTFDVDSRLEDLRDRVAALPPDTVVFFISMTRDADNDPSRSYDVLEQLHAVARVPIFAGATSYLGHGMLGGVMIDFERHGADMGRQAARMLAGELPPTISTPALTAVDWRELQRFRIPLARVPAGTTILYRESTVWERFRTTILAVAGVVIAQGVLIVLLVHVGHRRRQAQRSLEERLRLEKVLSELSLALTAADPVGIGAALDAALSRTTVTIGAEWAGHWEPGQAADDNWVLPTRWAEPVTILHDASELPPSIRARLEAHGCLMHSAVAVRIPRGGALFWVSGKPHTTWRAWLDDLWIAAGLVSNVLERRRAETAFARSDRLKGAILDSLPAHVAVLDRQGTIIAVNDSWTKFARSNGAAAGLAIGIGTSYTAACESGARAGVEDAAAALALVQAACRGEPAEGLEYRCDGPTEERWFLMRVEPLRREEGGAVVTHVDITRRKLDEIALVESEERFRRLADALPVAIWMAEAGGECSYVNRQWLEMTGRSFEQERGDGWFDSVHPDDRAACRDAYLSAWHRRSRFSIEYRIRHHGGTYRTVMDIGVPRYGGDGSFHGYVGGRIDITPRIEAVRMLRDLNRRLILAQEEERRRIARELHDHLNQQLALLAMDLQQLAMNPPESPEALVAALDADWRRTADITSDVHAISHRLHPSKLEALGLVATIRAHCRDLSRTGLAVDVSVPAVPIETSPDVGLCLYRVLEEALTNVRRHSGAAEVQVTLDDRDGELLLRIADRGRGFPAAAHPNGGLGLVSMRERLQALGGSLTITSPLGQGTIVEARLPRLASPIAETA